MAALECLELQQVVPRRLIECVWTIPSFMEVCRRHYDSELESPLFPKVSDSADQWRMYMSERNDFSCITIRGKRVTDNPQVRGSFEVNIVDSELRTYVSRSSIQINPLTSFSWEVKSFTCDALRANLLLRGTFIITCKIIEYNYSQFGPRKISCHYNIREKLLADCVLKINDHQIVSCHKAAMVVSPVLQKMLNIEMKEKKENVIDLSHILVDMETTEDFLFYMYDSEIPNIKNTCYNLLKVANYCMLEELKDKCQMELVNWLRVDNAADLWQLAKTYQAKWLEKYAWLFIRGHFQEVCETPGWKELKPEFLVDIFSEYLLVNTIM